MDSTTRFQAPYGKRVDLVTEALMASSTLDSDVAHAAAVQVLRALDSIPERIR